MREVISGDFYINRNVELDLHGTKLFATRTFLGVDGADLHPRYGSNVYDHRFALVARVQF
jgi:hypothetical protein